ncbi:MAG: exodeoxyribonuclease III [Alphaproteobacteria bacterium]|nr:exodeoxyribonuclease III [Alphaproteobacteria bacterium]MBU0858781.1 exodeoxyribonuclease III [Alphaproteobacteria bacterium]
MKLVSWNVNSIKTRLPHVTTWLEKHQPDVLMLQELKGLEFPTEAFTAIGYQSAAVTQKSYNGVAILARHDIKVVCDKLPGDDEDAQARYLEADVNGVRVIDIYLPNGNPVDTEKFPYKLAWMERLRAHVAQLRRDEVSFAIGGDFNVIPEPEDCYDPKAWVNDALFRPESRAQFRALLHMGLTDALRAVNGAPRQYTYWDYQGNAWPANKGIRIDHFLLSPALADRLIDCTIDPEPRGQEQPSDHTPIMVEIAA